MRPDRAQVLTQGLVAGFVSYVAVVIYFAVVNLIGGRSPFHTAAALGSVIFYGVTDPAAVTVEPGPVLAYNGIHLAFSLAAGMAAAFLLFETERHHFIWYFVLFFLLGGFLFALLAVGILGSEIAGVIPWWFAMSGTIVWVSAMGVYLWIQHRGLLGELEREQESEI